MVQKRGCVWLSVSQVVNGRATTANIVLYSRHPELLTTASLPTLSPSKDALYKLTVLLKEIQAAKFVPSDFRPSAHLIGPGVTT